MNERTPKHDPEVGLPESEKLKALEAATSTAREFIFERPRPTLRIVR